ncbi:MAG: CapA family protein [Candidatus Eisenbacteria bacterium]|nr:CapA family protein [Candidatus Eisenbacteria bacterium]
MRIVAVGDIGIHGRHADTALRDPESLLGPTRALLRGAEVVLGNLEIPLGAPSKTGPEGRAPAPATGCAPPQSAQLLRSWGFTHLSLANNHVMDMGPEGLAFTIERLREAGIVPFGAGADEEEARRPVRIDGPHRLALVGYSMRCRANATATSPGSAPFRVVEAQEQIVALRAEGRFVIVALHLGRMYLRRPSPEHRAACLRLLQAGAGLVLCAHAHVPAGAYLHEGRLAAAGLGDFLFDAYQGEIRTIVGRRSRRIGILLDAEIDATGTIRANRTPLLLPGQGGPLPHPDASRILRHWRKWDRELVRGGRIYALRYYLLEYPRLLVYILHAAFIHACRGNWRKAYSYTFGLVFRARSGQRF